MRAHTVPIPPPPPLLLRRLKGQFISHISHEVRTPLSVLSAAAGLLGASNPTAEQARCAPTHMHPTTATLAPLPSSDHPTDHFSEHLPLTSQSCANHPPNQMELIELLEAGAQHIILIVDDMLHYGQLESGNFTVVYEAVQLVREIWMCQRVLVGHRESTKKFQRGLMSGGRGGTDLPVGGSVPSAVR